MKTLIFLLLAVITSGYNIPKNNGCLQVDIMLVGDFSGSVMGHQQFVTDAFISFANSFELSEEGIKMGIVKFGDRAQLISDLNSDQEDFKKKAMTLNYYFPVGNTMLQSALELSVEKLLGSKGRKGYGKMIVIVSDGAVDDPMESLKIIGQLKQLGIKICTVLIKTEMTRPEYMQYISSDCYVESDYENLAIEIKKLDICS